mgnify:CR=1 FL=1
MDKSDLDKLIEQVIAEKTVRISREIPDDSVGDKEFFKQIGIDKPADKADKAGFKSGTKPEKAKKWRDFIKDKFAGLDGDSSDLTNLDVDAGAAYDGAGKGKINKTATQIRQQNQGPWKNYKKLADIEPGALAKKGTVGDATKLQKYEPETITRPRFYNAPSDQNAAKFLGSQNELILSVFKKNTIAERLKELDELTNNIFFNETWYEDNKSKPRTLVQAMMMADLMTHMFKEISGYAGDAFFESFCALMCGGNVTGTGMGAGDFVTADGKEGSSKFYNQYGAIKQAVSGFGQESGKSKLLHYVIAIKAKGEQTSAVVAGGGKSTSKANEVTYADLHYVIVQLTDQTASGDKSFKTYNVNNKELSEQNNLKDGTNIDIIMDSEPSDTYVGTIRLISGGVGWQEALENNVKDGSAKDAFAAAKNFFKELFDAEEKTKIYMAKEKGATDIVSSGNAALLSFDKADGYLTDLVQLLSGGKKIEGDKKNRELKQESLDNLIEAIIKQKVAKIT